MRYDGDFQCGNAYMPTLKGNTFPTTLHSKDYVKSLLLVIKNQSLCNLLHITDSFAQKLLFTFFFLFLLETSAFLQKFFSQSVLAALQIPRFSTFHFSQRSLTAVTQKFSRNKKKKNRAANQIVSVGVCFTSPFY